MSKRDEAAHGSLKSYTWGFGLSIVFTLAAYLLAHGRTDGGWSLIYLLAVLAIIQLFVQLVFFLHLGRESRPRWNLTVFGFAFMVVAILVFGSLWIMKNLSYGHQHLPSSQVIVKDEGYQP
jgi:cytochrome o ubiquinol oxidase operon protein cyoD